jgi:hypothetical protein
VAWVLLGLAAVGGIWWYFQQPQERRDQIKTVAGKIGSAFMDEYTSAAANVHQARLQLRASMVPKPEQRTPVSAIVRELALSSESLSAAQLAELLEASCGQAPRLPEGSPGRGVQAGAAWRLRAWNPLRPDGLRPGATGQLSPIRNAEVVHEFPRVESEHGAIATADRDLRRLAGHRQLLFEVGDVLMVLCRVGPAGCPAGPPSAPVMWNST